jgi:hypothetical protein
LPPDVAPPHSDNSAIRRVNELRGSNSLHLGFDKAPPKLAPYMI